MPLIDLKTDLKSLKYGHDRLGGGDSGQPYIKTDINNIDTGFNRLRLAKFDDGLIRGGIISATNASITDTIRIGKFLTDFPKGPLFIAKQVGLQLSNPRLEVPKNSINIAAGGLSNVLAASTNGLLEPTRIYNLGINTIAQIPVTAFGVHFNRHGILPVQSEESKYEAVVTANNNDLFNKSKNNRLVALTNKFKLGDKTTNLTINRKAANFINNVLGTIENLLGVNLPSFKSEQLIIDDYIGGPGSTYGLGSTIIKRYSFTEDKIKIDLAFKQSKALAGKTLDKNGNVIEVNYSNTIGVGDKAISNYGEIPTDNTSIKEGIDINSINYTLPSLKKYSELKRAIDNQQKLKSNEPNQVGIYDSSNKAYSSKEVGNISYKNSYNETVVLKGYSRWSDVARESRIGSGRQDAINLTPIFENAARSGTDKVNIKGEEFNIRDLVKFRIQALNLLNDGNITGNWMIFRAYLTQFQDSVDASWNNISYAGRGEDFYVYKGFSRKISIGFKVAALSAVEMEPMYQKLNYLMGNLMPDYQNELMRGPLVRMTVGNWIDGQDGILNSLSYTIPNDSPWEIALDEPEGGKKHLILPHIVDVSLSFTPIGSQTHGINKIAAKQYEVSGSTDNSAISHIAQNVNDFQYITNKIESGDFIK